MKHKRRRRKVGSIYTFALVWAFTAFIFPIYRIWGLGLIAGLSFLAIFLSRLIENNKSSSEYEEKSADSPLAKVDTSYTQSPSKKSYGPEIDPIVAEGNKALSEMGRLYMSIEDSEVKKKINEIMRITDKIVQDAIADPSDIPQIKKFMNYYLPTTIKLLNAYDRMSSQGIEGENIDRSMRNINDMLDSAIEAYKKRLDSLFSDQALDIETDIDVMNSMLAREGLAGDNNFEIK